mgnify:FL=1
MRALTLLASGLVAAGCSRQAGGTTGARLSAEPASFDFGKVVAAKRLHRDIVLRNVGDAELVIKGVSTTCNCTVVGDYAQKLAPGASTSMRIQLTTPETVGPTEQKVAIESNDSERPRVEIIVAATVVAGAGAAPRKGLPD